LLTHREIIKDLQPGRYFDGGGLHLRVTASSQKVWILRLTLNGVTKDISLGPLSALGLASARKLAKSERDRLRKAGDINAASPPKREKKAKVDQPEAAMPTFKWCASEYIRTHRAAWSERNTEGWTQTMRDYAEPIIGGMPVDTILRPDVMKVVEPIWTTKTETANRVLSRIRIILAWAKVNDYRKGDNPAAWKDNISFSLPDRDKIAPTQHHEALPFRDIPDFIAKLRAADDNVSRTLLFTILTATRSGEARGAVWGEFDLAAAEWTIPASRMKAGKEHRVPLAPQVVALIGEKPHQASAKDFAFPSIRVGRKNGALISPMTFCRLLKDMGYPTLTTHGFRSTFRDWAAETTDYANEVVEMALAHAIGSKVEAAYRRGNLLEKRRLLMNEWTAYCYSATINVQSQPD
jgi:integrase